MCNMVVTAVSAGEEQVLADVRKVTADPGYTPRDAKELCNRIFVTCYMGSENREDIQSIPKKDPHFSCTYSPLGNPQCRTDFELCVCLHLHINCICPV